MTPARAAAKETRRRPEEDQIAPRLVELLGKIPVGKRKVRPYFRLIEGLNRRHFY